MRYSLRNLAVLTVLTHLVLWAGCTSTIALYSPVAYEQAVSLKVEALALIDVASETYSDHADEVNNLRLKVSVAHEYAKGRPKNELSARQWEVLMDPTKGLLGDVLDRWKSEGHLSHVYVTEKRPYIAAAFDQIIGLESGKVKPASLRDN